MLPCLLLFPRPNKLIRLRSRRLPCCFWKDFHPLEDIESRLSKPGIQIVLHDGCKSCSLGFVMKVTDPKILFDDVTYFGDLFVSLDFPIRELGRGGVFAHDAISYLIL